MEVLNDSPKTSSFTSLAEHQSTTPASFYTGPPILHYFSDRCKLVVLESELDTAPALSSLVSKAAHATTSSATTNGTSTTTLENANGSGQDAEENATELQKTIEDIDVWVTSDKLLMYSQPAQTGLSIPYPSISLHAIQTLPRPDAGDTTSQGLYMQIISNTGSSSEDDEMESISVTVIPTASAPPAPATAATDTPSAEADPITAEDQPEITPVQAMFNALSNCSNLHPDPVQEGEEMEGESLEGSAFYQAGLLQPGINDGSGGLPPPMPGSGGWITAENMHHYFNEAGEYIGPGANGEDDMDEEEGEEATADTEDQNALGPGAGHVRTRPDGESMVDDNDETKWRRTN